MTVFNGTSGNDTLPVLLSTLAALGDDQFYGGAGNDFLVGFTGNDTFEGGEGADVMVGGIVTIGLLGVVDVSLAGNDTATYVASASGVTIDLSAKEDVLSVPLLGTSVDLLGAVVGAGGDAEGDVLVGIRNLTGSAFSDTLTGDDTANVLIGGGGNDRLDGGSGDDILMGGTGDDSYVIASAGDQVIEYAGEGRDSVSTYLETTTLAGNVEQMLMYRSAVTGIGNGLDNTIVGTVGDNTLFGGAGHDFLNGNSGADEMHGGTGDDIYVVAAPGDMAIEAAGEGRDTVRSYLDSTTLGIHIERLELFGAAITGTGNALDNTLVGTSAANTLNGDAGRDYMVGGAGNDLLNGGTGDDYLFGGAGDDRYIVSSAGDIVVEEAGAGTDTVHSYAAAWRLGSNLERLELQGAAVTGIGNEVANTLVGTAVANTLSGAAGDDYIVGGAGNDVLNGGIGHDVLIGGAGDDRFVFTVAADSPAGPSLRDTITDFGEGDVIDLSTIDANGGFAGDPGFDWIGTAAFSGTAGELRLAVYGPNALLMGDTDGDRVADMEIVLSNVTSLAQDDLIL